jgi:hypothetical protein
MLKSMGIRWRCGYATLGVTSFSVAHQKRTLRTLTPTMAATSCTVYPAAAIPMTNSTILSLLKVGYWQSEKLFAIDGNGTTIPRLWLVTTVHTPSKRAGGTVTIYPQSGSFHPPPTVLFFCLLLIYQITVIKFLMLFAAALWGPMVPELWVAHGLQLLSETKQGTRWTPPQNRRVQVHLHSEKRCSVRVTRRCTLLHRGGWYGHTPRA